jgi:hypothetical protein
VPTRRRARRPARIRRAPAERLFRQTNDFPVADGHDYVLKSIPREAWAKFTERAVVEQRSVRWILLTLIDRYSKGGITV